MSLGGAALLALRLSKLKRLHAPHGRHSTIGKHSSPRTNAFLINRGIMTPAILNMILGGAALLALRLSEKGLNPCSSAQIRGRDLKDAALYLTQDGRGARQDFLSGDFWLPDERA